MGGLETAKVVTTISFKHFPFSLGKMARFSTIFALTLGAAFLWAGEATTTTADSSIDSSGASQTRLSTLLLLTLAMAFFWVGDATTTTADSSIDSSKASNGFGSMYVVAAMAGIAAFMACRS